MQVIKEVEFILKGSLLQEDFTQLTMLLTKHLKRINQWLKWIMIKRIPDRDGAIIKLPELM